MRLKNVYKLAQSYQKIGMGDGCLSQGHVAHRGMNLEYSSEHPQSPDSLSQHDSDVVGDSGEAERMYGCET